MDKWLHPTLYNGCNYLSTLGLNFIRVSKWNHRQVKLTFQNENIYQKLIFSCGFNKVESDSDPSFWIWFLFHKQYFEVFAFPTVIAKQASTKQPFSENKVICWLCPVLNKSFLTHTWYSPFLIKQIINSFFLKGIINFFTYVLNKIDHVCIWSHHICRAYW